MRYLSINTFIHKQLNDENKTVIVSTSHAFKNEEEALLFFNNEYKFKDKEYCGRIGELVASIDTKKKMEHVE
jgi:hypothetical protein